MNKIQSVSQYLRWLFTVLLLATPLLSLLMWFVFIPDSNRPNHSILMGFESLRHYLPLIEQPLSFGSRFLGFLVGLVPTSINMLIYYRLVQLFSLYEQRVFFNLENVQIIRKIGVYLLLEQILAPVIEAATTVILTWHNSPGKRMLSVTFDSNNFGILITGVMIILISWIIAEGQRLNEENRLTI